LKSIEIFRISVNIRILFSFILVSLVQCEETRSKTQEQSTKTKKARSKTQKQPINIVLDGWTLVKVVSTSEDGREYLLLEKMESFLMESIRGDKIPIRQIVEKTYAEVHLEQPVYIAQKGAFLSDIVLNKQDMLFGVLTLPGQGKTKLVSIRVNSKKHKTIALVINKYPVFDRSTCEFIDEYAWNFDTPDIARIMAYKNTLYIVTRNEQGSLIFISGKYKDGRWKPLDQRPIEYKCNGWRTGYLGGSYDVFSLGERRSMFEIEQLDEETFVIASARESHVEDFPFVADHVIRVGKRHLWRSFLFLHKIPLDFHKPLTSLVVRTPFLELELHDLLIAKKRIFMAGRFRNPQENKQSNAWIISLNDHFEDISTNTLSEVRVIQSLALFSDTYLMWAGSTGWYQNPHGLSIRGPSYLIYGVYNLERNMFGEMKREKDFSKRHVEPRILEIKDGKVFCLGGVKNGPYTHTYDAEPQKLKGDGFYRCSNFLQTTEAR